MTRKILLGAVAALVLGASVALADAKYSVESTLGDLLDNTMTHAILQKYLPDLLASPQLDQGRGLTLHSLQQYMPNLTDDMLKQIDGELSKVQ